MFIKNVPNQTSGLCSNRPDYAVFLYKLSFLLFLIDRVEGTMDGSQMACRA